MTKSWKWLSCLIGLNAILGLWLGVLTGSEPGGQESAPNSKESFEELLPDGKLGAQIRLGQQLIEATDTHPLTKEWVGNSLQCTSCHLEAGRHPKAATFIGVATAYPAFAPREDRVITLEDRILNCFMRSMNGRRPANGGEIATAMTSYITWLSQGQSMKMNPRQSVGPGHLVKLKVTRNQADLKRGKLIYEDRCGFCHGNEGEGSEDGPPVWGDETYNQGAGFYKTEKLASWIKVAMPLDDASLSEQEAMDVAAFINSQPHPAFQLEDHLPATTRSHHLPEKE